MDWRLMILSLSAALIGCASNPIDVGELVGEPNYEVQIIDDRMELSRKGGSEGLSDSYAYLGDDMFLPSKLELISGAVSQVYETQPKNVVVLKFDVIHSFANMQKDVAAATLFSQGYYGAAAETESGPGDRDFVFCKIEVSVDGRLVSSSAKAEYVEAVSWFVGSIYNQQFFITAARTAVDEALLQWKERAARSPE